MRIRTREALQPETIRIVHIDTPMLRELCHNLRGLRGSPYTQGTHLPDALRGLLSHSALYGHTPMDGKVL
jgi:hypothetical protein